MVVKMKKRKFTKNTLKRALRTFFQAFFACFTADIVGVDFANGGGALKNELVKLGICALSAGIAAIMNLEEQTND